MLQGIVIGLSNDQTVSSALAAGLSGAVFPSSPVITAGLAEVAADLMAMSLGDYLVSRVEAQHYAAELARPQAVDGP